MKAYRHATVTAEPDEEVNLPDGARGVTISSRPGMLNEGVTVRYLVPIENDSKGGPE